MMMISPAPYTPLHPTCQVVAEDDSPSTCTPLHPTCQVVADDAGPHFEVVDDHGGEGGGRVEEGAFDHQDAHLLGADAGLGQQVLQAGSSRQQQAHMSSGVPRPEGPAGRQ